ncbi:MAG: CotH kinase family protein, partial [Planctomycetota bacterium]
MHLSLALVPLLFAAPQQPVGDDPARTFFRKNSFVQVRIDLSETAREVLRDRPREYTEATLQIDDATFVKVGIKLKGAAGSTREFDDRPGFTVHLGKFGGTERFHGLRRFHLNNGVQDDSRLSEWLGHEIFERAGYPAPRVAHARVREGERDLGVYVFREAFDGQFVRRVFSDQKGNLYDGGFCQDIDADLEKDSGEGPDDHSDLRRLAASCSGVDRDRTDQLDEVLDLDRFVDFAALEAMLGHWDGYTRNANNFRLFVPVEGRACFLPHGMDQLLQDPDASILDHPPAIVASAVMQQPALRKRYRERLRALLPVFAPDKLKPRLDAIASELQREWRAFDEDGARSNAEAVRNLEERFEARYRALTAQVKAPEPKPLQLAIGKPMRLLTWHPAAETDRVELGKKSFQGTAALHVHCLERGDEPRHGAFRTHVLLGKGRYELRGTARCAEIEPPPNGDDGSEHGGVCLRADGSKSERVTGK